MILLGIMLLLVGAIVLRLPENDRIGWIGRAIMIIGLILIGWGAFALGSTAT